MTYLDALESELATAGIPGRRRARIIAELTDHLAENAEAELGAPRDLARQFADELGTRLARVIAYRAFAVLGVAGALLVIVFFEWGRTWGGWVGYGSYRVSGYLPWWWVPMMVVWVVAAQVALASGVLALLRAWRLRNEPVISSADAAVLTRRAAVALVAGAITMLVLPLSDAVAGQWHWQWMVDWGGWSVYTDAALFGGPVLILIMLAMLPSVATATRLRPAREGQAADLTVDLGELGLRVTPWRAAMALSAVIVVVLTLIGVRSDDPYDGFARGLADAIVCLGGFAILGRYLGLRVTGKTAQ
jgi:hypothetical protein